MWKRWMVAAGAAGIVLAGCGLSRSVATENLPASTAHRTVPSPLQALRQLTPSEVAEAAPSGSLIPLLRHRWPKIPRTVWTTQISAMPFDGPHGLPVVVVTHLTGAHQTQDLLTYTAHGVESQSSSSIVSTRLASEDPGLVMGQVNGRPAFLVTSNALGNRVNLVWWTGREWHRVWSQVVTTTDQVSIQSVDRFVAGNTPGTTFKLVSGPQPHYRPVPSASSAPYWVIEPKQVTLGQPLTVVGSLRSDAGKTITLNWKAPNGALVQWPVPIATDGRFSFTETVPSLIHGHPAPAGSYTLSTVMDRRGDSMEVLQGFVTVLGTR